MTDRRESCPGGWDAGLSTGVRVLDEQHQALFACLNDLEKAATQQAMLATFHAMEQLSRYIRDHFSAEERLMKMYGYPWLAEHMQEHRSFSDKLFELRKDYLDHDISADLIDFLRDWLERHVAQTDMDYVPYLHGEAAQRECACAPGAEAGARTLCLLER
ncbi:MAG: hemerythrin family protein [Betaproteobacteria bacterium]|nr:hemerythrin family protein [Betaproteobacteria bacterium]